MPAQQLPKQELTLSEKMKVVQYLAIFPAISIMVFIRRKIGFRMLKPSRLIGIAMVLTFIDGLFETFGHPLGVLFTEFIWAVVGFGLFQRFRRWRELCRGEHWHTLSPGISYLEQLPLPGFLVNHRRLYRFVEPALCFGAAMLIGIFFSQPLARWIAFASICLFIYEQTLYEKQLDRDLDILDGLVAAEVQSEVVEYFKGDESEVKERTLQNTAGIPTGVAFDIHKQIERLRAKQAAAAAAAEAPKPEKTDERQVVEVTSSPTALPAPDNLAPETLELPPEKPEGQG
jgi:hypothetical protein